MAIDWQYPIYLIPLGGGYASVCDPDAGDETPHYLAVFTAESLAVAFMVQCEILTRPRALNNAREFSWLLQSLRHPVTQVAFDPSPQGRQVDARWMVSVEDLIQRYLRVDFSPWNYPLFVIAQEDGYASIEGRSDEGQQWRAVCLFTEFQKAEDYLRLAGESGEISQLDDWQQARDLLGSLAMDSAAVALDPVADGAQRKAKYCFAIETVLTKYLVREKQ